MEKVRSLPVTRVRQFEPHPAWFIHSAGGIHGLGHETRVLLWGQVLASIAREEDIVADSDVIGWASAVHDTQRWDDGIDPDHGERAADWIHATPNLIPPSVSLDRVEYLCRWHVPPDHMAPEMTPDLAVFKDADALDRWRIDDLDPSYLRTQSAHRLLKASYSLWLETRHLTDPELMFSQIVTVATEMGILRSA